MKYAEASWNKRFWFLYILQNGDEFYTGISTYVARRFRQHKKGKTQAADIGDVATLKLLWNWPVGQFGRASQLERYLHIIYRTNKQLFLEFIELDDIRDLEFNDSYKRLPLKKEWKWDHIKIDDLKIVSKKRKRYKRAKGKFDPKKVKSTS